MSREPDWEIFEKIRETNDKQRELLRERERELLDKASEADQLQQQFDQLNDANKDLRRKNHHISSQIRTLIEERADLQAVVAEQAKNVTALNKRLGMAQRDHQDLVQSQVRSIDIIIFSSNCRQCGELVRWSSR